MVQAQDVLVPLPEVDGDFPDPFPYLQWVIYA